MEREPCKCCRGSGWVETSSPEPSLESLCRRFMRGDDGLVMLKQLCGKMPSELLVGGSIIPTIRAFRWLARKVKEVQ